MTKLPALIFCFLSYVYSASTVNNLATKLANECFTPILRRGISNAVPIAELWNVSPFDCVSYCVLNTVKSGDGCSSLVYHKNFKTCQLYNHDGNYDGSKIVFAPGHDYYNRTSFTGICADPIAPSRPYPQGQTRPKAHSINTLRADQPVHVNPVQQKFGKKSEHYFLSNLPTTTCKEDQINAYILASSFGLGNNESPRVVINGVDREGCSNYCTQNINAVGDRSSCILFTHDSIEETCSLYDEAVKEIGIFTKIEPRLKPFSVAERICISKNVGCEDGISAFSLIYKQKINGYVLGQVNNLETIVDCLNICFGNPQCKVSF
ncbi:unnamed protein product [Bursaphelenchus okinawaensis]|uniref:Apple domain-containing protein n=1 Tax=Bursaphelenchus okinawaensis TaxID=465554 RepID=A0A811KN03_9BILA|nr:unnamed protein product [Bursaphelenchus okinawaensis]CAG9106391.1 unnamed protein product [Bursaphelenchus okinawaensis]